MSIRTLWNATNENDWFNALERYWDFPKPSHIPLEHEINKLDISTIEALSSEEFYNFLKDKYFVWKYTAPNRYATTTRSLSRYVLENNLEELGSIHKKLFTFDKEDIQLGLLIAKQIHGLGTAGASGLLSILFPSHFGTVDQFAVKALLQIPELPEFPLISRIKPDNISISEGVILIELMRRKASELNQIFNTDRWTPRKIDMVLWNYGR